jgi:hypothetical protein
MSTTVFHGTPEQQALADEILQIMRLQGSFYPADAPIKQTLTNLADFLSTRHNRDRTVMEQEIDAAVRENLKVTHDDDKAFLSREEIEGEVFYITSRTRTYRSYQEDMSHSFKQRFYEPENPLPVEDISVVVSTSRPVLTSVEPVFISDYWQEQAAHSSAAPRPAERGAGTAPPTPAIASDQYDDDHGEQDRDTPVPDGTMPETPAILSDTPPPAAYQGSPTPIAAEPLQEVPPDIAPDTISQEQNYGASDAVREVTTAPVVEPDETERPGMRDTSHAEADTVAAMPETPDDIPGDEAEPLETTVLLDTADGVEDDTAAVLEAVAEEHLDAGITLPDGTEINLGMPVQELLGTHIDTLETALLEQLEKDPLRRIVHFGRRCYPESGLVSLGKNDLRRIRDYIVEEGEPMADTAIIADLYYHNPRNADYEGFRFSLNYRLSREKDFEFVGVEGSNLWSAKGLATVGTKRVKAGEMAQMTSYLTENLDDSLDSQGEGSPEQTGVASRHLTFFEWQYGILPLDKSLLLLLPRPALPEQRSAILRIESPQHYSNFLVEMRFPTGNRGGWVQGFDAFFHEHLVAGAMITLARTDEPNVFTIIYEEGQGVSDRLLTLDEKKNKHAFADITYSCAVDNDSVVSQKHFGRAKNLKSLPMSERRKADVVLEHVFEVMGDNQGSREEPAYQMDMDALYVAYNVLRPASRSYLRLLLEEHSDVTCDDEELAIYSYHPEPEEHEQEEVELEEDEEEQLMRRWGLSYDDD